jgi:hypothetical protein
MSSVLMSLRKAWIKDVIMMRSFVKKTISGDMERQRIKRRLRPRPTLRLTSR